MNRPPDFIIAGSAKSGTTALHLMLDQHPGIYMSPIKETNYFFHGFEQTRELVDHRGERVFAHEDESDFIDTPEKYRHLFDGAARGAVVGEASPLYLIRPGVPERIHAHRADTRIVIIFRNPSDVAFANFVHQVRDRAESLGIDDIDRVFDADRYAQEGLYPFCHHLDLPKYSQHLPAWLARFDRAQMHFMVFEEFRADRRASLSALFAFLGLSDTIDIDVERRVNVSGLPRSGFVQSLLQGSIAFKKLVGLVVPKKPRRKIRAYLEALNTGRPVSMSSPVRARFDELYRDDVAFVEDLFGRRIDAWHRA